MSLATFTEMYIRTALWSSHDNADDSGGAPMDDNYGPDDIAPETLATMQADCADFYEANVATWTETYPSSDDEDASAGHDFWLTRNRHGAGFWDRGLAGNAGKVLTDNAHGYGSVDLYIGDDEKVHA